MIKDIKEYLRIVGAIILIILFIGINMYIDTWFMSVRMDWFGF